MSLHPTALDVFDAGHDHEQVVFCQRPGHRPPRDHRDPLHRPRPRARRHPLLPVRHHRRRAAPTCSTSPAACPTRPRSPGSTSAAARPSSSATRCDACKSEALLRAYGRFVQSLGGRYYTACDVGTFSADMDVIARECAYVTGRTVAHGGAGDSSVLTAYGVFQGMRAAAAVHLGRADASRAARVGVAGVGKVGHHLVTPPARGRRRASSSPTSSPPRSTGSATSTPAVRVVASTERAGRRARSTSTRRAPSAARSPTRSSRCSRATIVCGAANNQLAHPGVEKALAERGILYAPDYCVNSGGLIQVADELDPPASPSSAPSSARRGSSTPPTRSSSSPRSDGVPPAIAADRLAERRMRDVGRLRGIWRRALSLTSRRHGPGHGAAHRVGA